MAESVGTALDARCFEALRAVAEHAESLDSREAS